MNIKHEHTDIKGAFIVAENNQDLAKMTYVMAGEDRFIIDHTEVYPGQEGKGLGKILVKAAVEFARSRKYKIVPLCPFAKSVFEKNADYNDVKA